MLFAKSPNKEAIKTSTSILYGDIPTTKYAGKVCTWEDWLKTLGLSLTPADTDEDVTCVFNKHGYRCPEFTAPRGDLNVVSLGCSETAGLGVSVENRFSSVFCNLLAASTGKTVVDWNMGVPAKSNDFIGRCVPSMATQLRPDLVLVCFTYLGRREHVDWNGRVFDYLVGLPISVIPGEMLEVWKSLMRLSNHNSNLMNVCRNMVMINNTLEKEGIPWLYAFLSDESSYVLKEDNFVGYFDHIDLAGDKMHAGPKSHRWLAEKYFNKYNALYKPKNT